MRARARGEDPGGRAAPRRRLHRRAGAGRRRLVIPPDTYWPEIQRIFDKYGILLVSDEVICGFGRTGHWFGCEHFGTRPDFMTMAKALTSGYLPLGGLMVGDRVAEVLIDKGGEFVHGFTYSGHPVACAVAIANLEIFRREKIVERVRDETAPYLAARWRELVGPSAGRRGALPGPAGGHRAGAGQELAALFRAARRGRACACATTARATAWSCARRATRCSSRRHW